MNQSQMEDKPLSTSMLPVVVVAPEEITAETSAYTKHFKWIVESIIIERKEFHSLLLKEEIDLGRKILKLSPTAILIYARLFTRTSHTFFSSELIGDRFRQSSKLEITDVKKALIELLDIGMICFPLDGKINNTEAFSLVRLLTKPALIKLNKRLGGNSKLNSSNKSIIIDEIFKLTKKQKTLFGGEIQLYKHIKYLLKDFQNIFREGGHDGSSSNNNNNNNKNNNKQHLHDAIIQLSNIPRTFCRRLYNLFYMTSITTEDLSSTTYTNGNNNNNNNNTRRNNTNSPTFEQRKNLRPLPNDGLMVMFGKRKYHNYKCNLTKAIFPTRDDLLNFEQALSFQDEVTIAYIDENENNMKDDDNNNTGSNCSCSDNIKSNKKIIDMTNSCALSIEISNLINQHISYEKYTTSYRNFSNDIFQNESFGTCVGCKILNASAKLSQCTLPVPEQPRYLYRFSEGAILTNIVWEGVAYFEKQGLHHIAVYLLLQLIQNPYSSSRRRGKWWIRLLVDINHLKWPLEKIYKLSLEAKIDPLLYKHGGEMMDIEKRSLRLLNNLNKLEKKQLNDINNDVENNNNNSSMNHHIINNENASKSFLEALPKEHLWVITDKALNRETGYKSRFIGFDNEIGCSVEELVLQHFQLNEGGWTGLHCEGSPMRTLFGLLMWDVIFIDDVPNVFATAFQRCPLDFGMEEFAQARETPIKEKLLEISIMTKLQLIKHIFFLWDLHYGTECIIPWDRIQVEILSVIAGCLGGKHLSNIFSVLASNYRHWGGGLPDLLLWRIKNRSEKLWLAKELIDNDNKPTMLVNDDEDASMKEEKRNYILDCFDNTKNSDVIECEAMFMEVKGPRDRLDGRQTAWLKQLIDFKIPAGVCRVQEPKKITENGGAKRKAKKEPEKSDAKGKKKKTIGKKKKRDGGDNADKKTWRKIDKNLLLIQDDVDFE